MKHIFYIIGKSSSGKDTIFKNILNKLNFKPFIMYTTRPIRVNEKEGREYHFVDKDEFQKIKNLGSIIEERHYNTVFGEWIYFTVKESINLNFNNLGIGTLQSYFNLKDYFGSNVIVPIYVEVDDKIRLRRAVAREQNEINPKYHEVSRRFWDDIVDFSEKKLIEARIINRFNNNKDIESCVKNIKEYILNYLKNNC